MFCTEHVRKGDKVNGGMYIPFPHDHPKWIAAKQKKQAAWKKSRNKAKASGKPKTPDADPASDAAPIKLSLSNTFKAVQTSKVHLSNQEADFLVNEAEKAAAAGSLIKG